MSASPPQGAKISVPMTPANAIKIAAVALIALAACSLRVAADPADSEPQTQIEPSTDLPLPVPPPAPKKVKPLRIIGPQRPPDVSLYEEDPKDPYRKRWRGSVVWRAETVSPGEGQPPEIVVRADVEVPERQVHVTWTLRREMDLSSPASHTVDISFNTPPDFSPGGISDVPGVVMKQNEQAKGVALVSKSVKVTAGVFLIGLSNSPSDREHNMQLLKERPWFDIAMVYNNNRRAILAIAKGAAGERAFDEAFAAWGK